MQAEGRLMEEDAFIEAILEHPGDDASRLVYADWLEERGDPTSIAKAQFLRTTEEWAKLPRIRGTGRGRRKPLRQRLQQLTSGLDTRWLAAVSRLPLENCPRGREQRQHLRASSPRFDYVCPLRWDDLTTTDNRTVRNCETCQQHVYYCDTITEAREHARNGHCVAIDLGVIRRDRDLEARRLLMGKILPDSAAWRREEERMQPDPVSAERERRRREGTRRDEPTS
jgi:uncharacterized protein (TIGR02996 family)